MPGTVNTSARRSSNRKAVAGPRPSTPTSANVFATPGRLPAAPAEHRIEVRIRGAETGEYRWFYVHALPQRGADGRVVRWFGTCTDIDDRKRAEEALRYSEERLRQLVALMPPPFTLAMSMAGLPSTTAGPVEIWGREPGPNERFCGAYRRLVAGRDADAARSDADGPLRSQGPVGTATWPSSSSGRRDPRVGEREHRARLSTPKGNGSVRSTSSRTSPNASGPKRHCAVGGTLASPLPPRGRSPGGRAPAHCPRAAR